MKHADYVIIRGEVFRWEEKAPFTQSGKSIMGAVEYDRDQEKLKCHECGTWHRSLAIHIARSHSAREYRQSHGLFASSPLITPAQKRASISNLTKGRELHPEKFSIPTFTKRGKFSPKRAVGEYMNIVGSCPAQTLLELRKLAEKLGHVPTSTEAGFKLTQRCQSRFGSFNNALKQSGLEPGHNYSYHSRQSLIESLIDFYVLNRRLPKWNDMGRGRLASLPTFKKHFGSLPGAFYAAGLGLVFEGRAENPAA